MFMETHRPRPRLCLPVLYIFELGLILLANRHCAVIVCFALCER